MNKKVLKQLEGGCSCGHVRYRLLSQPLFVHCCHCLSCQRETGASFALNAMIEARDQGQLVLERPGLDGFGFGQNCNRKKNTKEQCEAAGRTNDGMQSSHELNSS